MRKLFLSLCWLAMLGMMAACGRGGSNTQDAYSWWMISTTNDYYNSMNDNPVIKYLQDRFNVKFEFEQPVAGTESDALALMMGTGRYTNIMHLSTYSGSIPQLFYDGIIIDIAEWLEYMPNLSRWLKTDLEFARIAYDDEGRILGLPSVADEETPPWSGLMYRHDILETMTGGNVRFPSGQDVPTTIEDWEYMLPLFLAYFEAAGFADYGPLILPATPIGIFHFGELMNSFGAYYSFYMRDGIVHAGMLEPAMYKYISTMRDWYEKGWIHRDFASRVGDMFFMPNPPLVFGGAAGAWFGMMMHMGDRMSMPEYGLIFDVRAMPSPMAPGITHRDMVSDTYAGGGFGNAIYSGTKDIGRLLTILDYLYTDEGGLLRSIGPNASQIPEGYTVLERMGMPHGSYQFDENGNVVFHPNMEIVGGTIPLDNVNAVHLAGYHRLKPSNDARSEEAIRAHAAWSAHKAESEVYILPGSLTLSEGESSTISTNNARITDLTDQMMALFITGRTPLNDTTWNDFLNRLKALGIEENQAIYQRAVNRFLTRGQQ